MLNSKNLLVVSGSLLLVLAGLLWLGYSSLFSKNVSSGAIASAFVFCVLGLELFSKEYRPSGPEMERVVRIVYYATAILVACLGGVSLAYCIFVEAHCPVWAKLGLGSLLIFGLLDIKKGPTVR
jgi:hypothetical protein